MLKYVFLLLGTSAGLYICYDLFNRFYRKKITQQRWVIFDFDGTIAESFLFVIHSVNAWAKWYRFAPIREDEHARLRHYSIHNLTKNRLGLHWYQLPLFHYRIKKTLLKHATTAEPYKGIREELEQLKAAGYKIAVVSSNSKAFICAFFKKHKLPHFDAIEESSIFGKHRFMSKCIRHNGINPELAIYIGDEARDIEAAKKIPLQMIAVSWGGSSAQLLVRHMPTAIVHQPDALSPLIKAMVPAAKTPNSFVG
jgi:phosphoglycolate phosphatase-like HAD superfamily hydrolase